MLRGCLLPLLLVLLLLGVAPSYAADDEAAKARAAARKELLEEAGNALRREGGAAIAAMQRGVAADRDFVAQLAAGGEAQAALLAGLHATLADRVLLVGEPATEGALQDADRLLAWLAGRSPCEVLLSAPEGDAGADRSYEFPPPKPALKNGPPIQGEAPPASGAEPAPEPAKAEESEAKAPAPTAEERLADWAKAVREKEGESFITAHIKPARCTVISRLLAAADGEPAYVDADIGVLHRHALVTKQAFAYNLPHVVLRGEQADARGKALQADRPQASLVDSSMIREKAAAVRVFQEAAAQLEALQQGVLEALDRMVVDLDGWKTQAALLAGEIGDRRAALRGDDAPAQGDESTDPAQAAERAKALAAREAGSLPLRLAQARETLTTIEITLLYQTVVRAQLRLDLLERLRDAVDRDTHAAETRHHAYAEALLTLRSTRRLDRLVRDRRALLRWAAPLREVAPAAGSSRALRLAAYDALLAVNEAVQEAVRRRSEMAVGAVEPGPPDGDAPAPDDGEAGTGPRLSKFVAEPSGATWDVKYLEIARRELLDPELLEAFDVSLVAEHFAEASERVNALVAADRAAQGRSRLVARFDAASAKAEAALQRVASDLFIARGRKLPAMLAAAEGDFEAAMSGIAAQQSSNRERMRVLVSYQALLRSQGTRSLLIRMDRSHRDPYFGEVMRDTRGALESAGAWASFQGESHVGRFLSRTWPRLLLMVAALAAMLVVVRLGRGLVDRWIDSMVSARPNVRASVRDERAQAKRRRARTDQAAHAITEDDVLQQVDVPEEDPEEGSQAGELPPAAGATS